MGMDLGIARRQGLELVGGAHQGQAGLLCQGLAPRLGEAGGAVQTGTDRGAPQRQLTQMGQGGSEVTLPLRELGDPAGDLLTQGERGGVLQVGAANLDKVVEGGSLAGQRVCRGRVWAAV